MRAPTVAVVFLVASLAIGTLAAADGPTRDPSTSLDSPTPVEEANGSVDLEVETDGGEIVYLLATRQKQRSVDAPTSNVQLWVSENGGRSFRDISPADTDGPNFVPGEPEAALAVDRDGAAYLGQRSDLGVNVFRERGSAPASGTSGLWWTRVETQPRALAATADNGWFAVANHRGEDDTEGWISVHRAPTDARSPEGDSYGIWEAPGRSALALTGEDTALLAHTNEVDRISLYEVDGTGPPTSGPEEDHHQRGEPIRRYASDEIGAPALAVDERGSVYLAWAERIDDTVRVHLAEESDTDEGWTQRFTARTGGSCLPALELTSLEEGVALAFDPRPCTARGEPRLLRLFADGGRAVGTVSPLSEIDPNGRPCSQAEGCEPRQQGSSVSVGALSDGRVLVAWTTEDGTIAVGVASPDRGPQRESAPRAPESSLGAPPPVHRIATVLGVAVGAAAVLAASGRRQPPLLLPLYSRTPGDEVLDNERRQRIRDLVEERPGIHSAELRRQLSLSPGNLAHHVSKLVEAGILRDRHLGGYRCFFLAGATDPEVERGLSAVRAQTAREIVTELEGGEVQGVRSLARAVGRAASTVSHHLDKLESSGVIDREDDGPRASIRLTPLGERILEVMPDG